jgi:hypothetical protein
MKREVTAPKPWRRRVTRFGGVPLYFSADATQLAPGIFTEDEISATGQAVGM